jgi:uncharacterized protein
MLQQPLQHYAMFEWDAAKNAVNLQKHGIAFEEVLPVFASPDALTLEDRRRHYGESRWVVMGPVQGVIVCVTYTLRGENVRIISARRANRRSYRRILVTVGVRRRLEVAA